MKTKPCRYCNGTGKETDQAALGKQMRKLREACGRSLRDVARGLGVSAPYLSDLELGERNWSEEKIEQFRQELNKGKR